MWIRPLSPGVLVTCVMAWFASLAVPLCAQVPQSAPNSVETELQEMRAENSAMREQLRKLEEQQQTLLKLVGELERRLDGQPATVAHPPPPSAMQPEPPLPVVAVAQPKAEEPALTTATPTAATQTSSTQTAPTRIPPTQTTGDSEFPYDDSIIPAKTPNDAKAPEDAVHDNASTTPSQQSASVGTGQDTEDRYTQDGMVIAQTPDGSKVPLLLVFNINNQIRYLNTLSSDTTYTDHLGVVHDVNLRNDITVNRAMLVFGGYIFDKRLRYSFTVWTSAGAASIVVAGNVGWQFNKAFTLTAGYTGVPGTRSLINTFPYFTANDRSMADNFFRPGFTQGAWASGQILKNLNYIAFIGNGLNTLNISAAKIDANLLFSGSVWWEPLGAYGPPGKSRNMYDDYFASKKVRIRIGTSFTRSREDSFSNLNQSGPENTALTNSDGVNTFSTGAFAPGVTLEKALYRMWAIDGGLKWNGLAVNGQYYFRVLNDFVADGPLPLASTFDHGFELSQSYFVIPRKVMVYGRGSKVFGQFGNSWEYAAGVRWNFLRTERVWLNAEMMRVNKSPYTGTFSPYVAGLTGWVPMIQTYIAF